MTRRRQNPTLDSQFTAAVGYRPAVRVAGLALIVMTVQGVSACSAQLPEPESAGALLYARRCDTCHRLYAPSSMKYDMWAMQVERMQGEMVRRGIAPLTEQEHTVLLGYLKRHSG